MQDRIFLLVRCTVETGHQSIYDAIAEFQEQTQIKLTSTPNVIILQAEIVKLNTKNLKN
jgi:hypothetical protein